MDYPLPNFHFQVEWGNDTRVSFSRVRNLSVSTTPIQFRNGNDRNYSQKVQPGRQVFDNFILERPIMHGDNDFFDWWKSTYLFEEGGSTGSIYRRSISIKLLNENHEPVVVWQVENAWPVRLSWSEMDARGNAVMMEYLEIACEGIVLVHN